MKTNLKKCGFAWMLAAGLLFTCGCTTVDQEDEKKDDGPHPAALSELSKEERAELLKFGKDSGEQLLAAVKSGNRDLVTEVPMHPECAKLITEENFQKLVKSLEESLGVATDQQYWGSLRVPLVETFIWRVEFTQPPAKDGEKPIVRDLLFRVAVGRPDGQFQVTGFGFGR